jgi:hypothetical protein
MALVGIPDHCAKRGPVGWARRFRFLDQIAEGLLADHWKDNIAHDAIRFLQSRAGDQLVPKMDHPGLRLINDDQGTEPAS